MAALFIRKSEKRPYPPLQTGDGMGRIRRGQELEKNHGLNKSQRMQLKALACVLGVFLLLFLLLGKLALSLLYEEDNKEARPLDIPVMRLLKNVWIMEVDEEKLKLFHDGQEESYSYSGGVTVDREAREQVADILLYEEQVLWVHSKTEKQSGRVLALDEESVELEGIGRIFFAPSVKGYRLYDALTMCTPSDLKIGYDFADFVLEDGQICAILLARDETMADIRVLIKNSGYTGTYHEKIEFTCDTDFLIRYGEGENRSEETHRAGEVISVDAGSDYFQGDRIYVVPTALTGRITLYSAERSQGIPAYRGSMEFLRTSSGLVVINEVSLEEYLYSVVPSEMPSSYPKEALKAQAVCARTYAYKKMLHAGYPEYGAHVDDSSSYQVYNNILEQERTTAAVKDTYGQLLFTEDGSALAETYYYSTSCGIGSDTSVWGSQAEPIAYLDPKPINLSVMKEVLEDTSTGAVLQDYGSMAQELKEEETFRNFIQTVNKEDFESEEGWYRWSYTVENLNRERMLSMLQARYKANKSRVLTLNENGEYESLPIEKLGNITDLYIAGRGAGGIAQELIIETDAQTIKVLTEHNVRCILNDGEAYVLQQNGKKAAAPNMLPSAFFVIDAVKEDGAVTGYTLTGGGFGHGVGMSQNGARGMASAGYTAEEILTFFYKSCVLKNIYEVNG